MLNTALSIVQRDGGPGQPKRDAEKLNPLVRVMFVRAAGIVKPPPLSCKVPKIDRAGKVVPLIVTVALPRPLPMITVFTPNVLPPKHGVQFRAARSVKCYRSITCLLALCLLSALTANR